MSSIVNKVKDALLPETEKTSTTHSTHDTSHHVGSTEPRTHQVHNTATSGTVVGGAHESTFPQGENYVIGSTGANRGNEGPASKTDGPHASNLGNKLDPRVDSDRDHSKNLAMNPQGSATTGTDNYGTHSSTTGTGHTGSHGTRGTHTTSSTRGAGFVGSGVRGGDDGRSGPATRTDGPHESNLANKLDPRVDSDRDHSRNMGANPQGTASTGTHGTTGASGLGNTGVPSSTHGSSHVGETTSGLSGTTGESDQSAFFSGGSTGGAHDARDTHATHGITGTGLTGSHGATRGGSTGLTGSHGTSRGGSTGLTDSHGTSRGGSTGLTGSHGTSRGGSTGLTGSHHTQGTSGSGMTDTGLTGSHNTHSTSGAGMTGTHGTTGPSGNGLTDSHKTHGTSGAGMVGTGVSGAELTGHHGHSDTHHAGTTGAKGSTGTSGTAGSHGTHGSHATHSSSGPGPAPHTAGPHKSDLLNKMDPRVDSNLDGSKTIGGNKTALATRDPTDAAQVPPSVLQKHVGKPSIEHGDVTHGRERRHSISQQELYRGI